VTFTATVSPTPTGGTVQFLDGGINLGSPVAVDTGTGEASFSTTALGAGTHEITAVFEGFQTYETSTTAASILQEVGQAALTVKALNSYRSPNTPNPDPFPYEITGYQNGENLATSGVTGTPVLTTDATLSSPVGSYVITCAPGTLAASNYSFTLVDGTLTITDLVGQLGVLNLNANNGINPATGNPWALGDTYRLIFVTRGTTEATSTDISTYNAFVQSEANASTAFPTLGSVSWSVVGSTAAVAARDNTATNPAVLMDGTTLMATDYANLWSYARPVVSPGFDQNGDSFLTDRVFTGSTEFGVQDGSGRVLGGSSEATPVVTTGRSDADWNTWAWMANWNEPTTQSKPVYAMSEVLTVVSSTPQTPFATWAGGEPFDGDKNGDGVDNGIAFLLGAGDPDAAALGLLPAAANDGSGLVLEFSMLNAANRGDAKLSVQWSQDLGVTDPWENNVAPVPDADGTVNGVVFEITEGDPLNTVKATIPSSEGPEGRLFSRLSGSEN
jgi:hypothetical protein